MVSNAEVAVQPVVGLKDTLAAHHNISMPPGQIPHWWFPFCCSLRVYRTAVEPAVEPALRTVSAELFLQSVRVSGHHKLQITTTEEPKSTFRSEFGFRDCTPSHLEKVSTVRAGFSCPAFRAILATKPSCHACESVARDWARKQQKKRIRLCKSVSLKGFFPPCSSCCRAVQGFES